MVTFFINQVCINPLYIRYLVFNIGPAHPNPTQRGELPTFGQHPWSKSGFGRGLEGVWRGFGRGLDGNLVGIGWDFLSRPLYSEGFGQGVLSATQPKTRPTCPTSNTNSNIFVMIIL